MKQLTQTPEDHLKDEFLLDSHANPAKDITPNRLIKFIVLKIIIDLALFSCFLIVFTRCGSPISEIDSIKNKSWSVKSVLVDGVDYTSFYSGMTLSFSEGKFSTTNGGATWYNSGTWKFMQNSENKIIRDDGLIISIDVLSKTSLQLSFDWESTTLSGRVRSVKSKNIFVFN